MSTRFNGKKSTMTLAAGNAKAASLLAGKTLNQVGFEFGLEDEHITIGTSTNPNSGEEIKSLAIVIEGEKFVVPFARKYPFERMNEAEWLLDCQFRQTFKSIKDENGDPELNEDGTVKLDETAPYLSFGKPDGIVFTEEVGLFEEPKAEAKANASVGGKGNKANTRR